MPENERPASLELAHRVLENRAVVRQLASNAARAIAKRDASSLAVAFVQFCGICRVQLRIER